jgi:hypothetical protein
MYDRFTILYPHILLILQRLVVHLLTHLAHLIILSRNLISTYSPPYTNPFLPHPENCSFHPKCGLTNRANLILIWRSEHKPQVPQSMSLKLTCFDAYVCPPPLGSVTDRSPIYLVFLISNYVSLRAGHGFNGY